MKKTFFALCIILCSTQIFGQDKHFSQFYASPLTLNPALTGLMDGKYRAAIAYRNQWNSILSEPFVTSGVAFDGKFSPYKGKGAPDFVGLGASVFSDKAGQTNFTTNAVMISSAFHKALDLKGKNYLTGGFQFGLVQNSVNLSGVSFGDQFDGTTGYTIPTAENFDANNITFGDMSAGLFWSAQLQPLTTFYLGGAIHHFNRPNTSFYRNVETSLFTTEDPYNIKYTLHGGAIIRTKSRLQIEPRAVVFIQGNHLEVNVGTSVGFVIDEYLGNRFFLGAWLRPVGDIGDSIGMDAVVVSAGLQLQNIIIGTSYDLNISGITSETVGRGAFELSLTFIGDYENDNVICPTF